MNRPGRPPQRAGWRRSSRSTAPAPPTGGYVVGQTAAPRLKLMFRVSMFAALMLGLAVILYLILRPPPPYLPLVATAVTRYNASPDGSLPAPPNPFAQEDLQRFERLFGEDNRVTRNVQFYGQASEQGDSLALADGQFMQRLLDPLRSGTVHPGGPDSNVLAFFISAHGQTDRNNQPCLLLADSRPDDESTWLPVADLLQQLRQTIDQEMPAGTRAIVFLDAARWPGQWTWGDLHNTFARRCESVVRSAVDADTAVVLAAGPGQRSWVDVRSGGSLFAMALSEAFGGQADGAGPHGQRDGSIALGEMADYLQARVSAAAQTVWDAPQLPRLIASAPDAAQWTLMSRPNGRLPTLDQPDQADHTAALRLDWNRVDPLWKNHTQLSRLPIPPEIYDPVAWSALEHRLQRLDQLAISGAAYESEFDSLLAQCNDLLGGLNGTPLPVSHMPPEMALLDRFGTPTQTKPVDMQPLRDLWREKPDPAQWKTPMDEATAIRLLWGDAAHPAGWLQSQGFSAEALAAADRLLVAAKALPDGKSQLLESHWIRMFAQPDLQRLAGRPIEAIYQGLQASRAAQLPDDLRALYWLADEIALADQARRLETDRVLAYGNDTDALARLRRLAEEDGRLDRLQQQGARLSAAYRTYDRALHHLPRLAETLLADPGAFYGRPSDSSSDARLLAAATDAVLRLGQRLQVPRGPVNDNDIAGVVEAAKNVDAVVEQIERRLADRVGRVVDREADDPRKLRQALALLTGTGVTDAVGRRTQLRKQMLDLIQDSRSWGQPAISDDVPSLETADSDALLAQSSLAGGRHFLLHWLDVMAGPDGGTPATSSNPLLDADTGDGNLVLLALDRQGAEVRQATASLLHQDLGTALAEPDRRLRRGESALQARLSLAEIDRGVRAQTLLVTSGRFEVSVAPKKLFGLDHQLFLTAMARRVLDDFWCEASSGEAPFFPDAARRTWSMLATDWSHLPPLVLGSSVLELAEERQRAATNPMTLRPRDESILYRNAAIPEVPVQLALPSHLPDGEIAVLTERDPSIKTVALDAQAAGGEVQILGTSVAIPAGLDDAVQTIAVRSFYRGLRRTGLLMLGRPQGARLATYQLPDYGPPQILVRGEDPDPVPVVLVLDCSHSMLARDIPTPGGGTQTRMQVAKEALAELLTRMQATGQFRVGLILYGRRWGWETSSSGAPIETGQNPQRYRARDSQTGGFHDVSKTDEHGNPAYDVEVVGDGVGRGALDRARLNDLQATLTSVQPHGTTPLYLAVSQAFALFGRLQPPPETGHVIVLTDGRNDIRPFGFGPQSYDGEISNPKDAKDAADEGRRKGIDLTVLLINKPDDKGRIEDALSGAARVVNVQNKPQLIAQLEQSIPRNVFEVVRGDGATVAEENLGNMVTVEPWPPAGNSVLDGRPVIPSEPYRVQVVDAQRRPLQQPITADVWLQGGEYLELALRGNRILEHIPYRPELRGPRSLKMSGPGAEQMDVMVLSPEPPVRQTLEIPIVVQHADPLKFSPRPAGFWADITAVGDSRRQQYCVTDMEFEAGRPVPVIRCRVHDWPTWASHAEIRVWIARDPVRHESLPLDRVGQAVEIPGIEGVRFTVQRRVPDGGGYELHVLQEQDPPDQGRGVFRLKVDLSPLPDSASHAYYPENGLVNHVFRYDREITGLRAGVTEHRWFEAASARSELIYVEVPKK